MTKQKVVPGVSSGDHFVLVAGDSVVFQDIRIGCLKKSEIVVVDPGEFLDPLELIAKGA